MPVKYKFVRTSLLYKGGVACAISTVSTTEPFLPVIFVNSFLILTSEVGQGKIALMGELLVPPLLGGLILFSFWRRLQNQTRITSFSMFSWSAIMVISSEVGFWFCEKKMVLKKLWNYLMKFYLIASTSQGRNMDGPFISRILSVVQ